MGLPVELADEIELTKDEFDETMIILLEIKHKKCHNAAIDHYWKPCWDDDRKTAIIRPNNIFWLYFWAETGQGSKEAARQSKIVFYDIFGSERPYRGTKSDHENFFDIFDAALGATGLRFRTYHSKNPKSNPVRTRLRPYNCTRHCREIFEQVMENIHRLI